MEGRGRLVVADTNNFRIVILSAATGDFLAVWITLGSVLNAEPIPGKYRSPKASRSTRRTTSTSADTFNDRIQKLSPSGEPLVQ